MDPPPPPNPAGTIQKSNPAASSSIGMLQGYTRPAALPNGMPEFAFSNFKFGAAAALKKDPNALLASKIQNINNQAESKEKHAAAAASAQPDAPKLAEIPAIAMARPSTMEHMRMPVPDLPTASEQTPVAVEKTTAMDTDDSNHACDYSFTDEDSQMAQHPQQPLPTLDREQSSFMRLDTHHSRPMESLPVIPQKRHLPASDQPSAPVDRPGTGYPGSNHPREVLEGQGQRRMTRPNGLANPRPQNGMGSQRSSTMQNPQQKKRMMALSGSRQGTGPGPARRPAPRPAPQAQTRPPRAGTDNSSDTVIILDDDEDEGISAIKKELAAAASVEEQNLGLPLPPSAQPRLHLPQAQHEMQQQVRGMRPNSGHNPQLSRAIERVNSSEHNRQPLSGLQGHSRRTPSGRSSGSQQTSMSVASDATAGTTEGALANAVAQLSQQKGALEKKLQDTMHALKEKSHTVEEMAHKNIELTKSIDEYQKKIEGMRTRYKEFEKFLDGLGNDYKMLNDQKTILTRRIDELDGYNRDLEAERQVLHDRVENALQNQKDWREAENQYERLEREYHKLQATYDAATKEIAEKGLCLVEEKNRNVSLEAQMMKEREAHEEVVKVLNGFKDELVENIKSLETKLAEMNSAKTDDLQSTLTSLKESLIEAVKNGHADTSKGLTDLEACLHGVTTSVLSSMDGSSGLVNEKLDTVLNDIVDSLKDDHERLKKDLLELSEDQKRLTVLEVEKASLELRFQHLEQQSQERQDLIVKLQAKENDYKEKIKQLEAEIERLSVAPPEDPRIASMQRTIDELSVKIKAAEESLHSSEEICKAEQEKFNEKSAEYNSLHAEIESLRKAHNAALKRIEGFDHEKKAFAAKLEHDAKEERMDFEKRANAHRNKELQKINNQLRAVESQKASLEKKLAEMEKSDDQRLKDMDEQIRKLKDESQAWWTKHDQKVQEIESLKNHQASLEKDLGLFKQRAESQTAKLRQQKESIMNMDKQLGEANTANGKLSAQLSALTEEKQRLENEASENTNQLRQQQESIVNLEKQIADSTKAHAKLVEQKLKLAEAKKRLENEVASNADKISQLENQKSGFEKTIAEKDKALAAHKAETSRHSSSEKTLQLEVKTLSDAKARLEYQVNAHADTIRQLQVQKTGLEKTVSEKEVTITTLKGDKTRSSSAEQTVRMELKMFQDRLDSAGKENDLLCSQVDAIRREKSEIGNKFASEKVRADRLASKYEEEKKRNEELSKKMKDLERVLEEKEAQIRQLMANTNKTIRTTTVDTITVLAQTTVIPSTPDISPERRNTSGSERTLDETTIPATQFRILDDDDSPRKEADESSIMAQDVQSLVDALDVTPDMAKDIQNWTSQTKAPRKTRRSSVDGSPLSSPIELATPKAIRQFKNQQSAGATSSSSPKGSQMSPPKTDRKRKKDHDRDPTAPVPEIPKRQTTRAIDAAQPNKQRRVQPQRRRLTETPQKEKDSTPAENIVQQPSPAPVRKPRVMKTAKKAKATGF